VTPVRKVLIANRGEIAVRVIRACREMGLESVAVFSECDRTARHVRMADEAVAIGPNPPAESYLRIDRLIDAARASGADAVHPGYGFLSENEDFAAACRDAGLTFIGPTAEAIALMGSKTAARRVAIAAGVPVVPGTQDPIGSDVGDAAIAQVAAGIGFPVMVKAVAGGGGKGMRVVETAADLASAIRAARSEAGAAFGDSAIYLERRLVRPRHIEVQLLADHHGTVLPCVERECSIQRRHQKVIEEAPGPTVTADLRDRLTAAAAAVAASVGYVNAGTIEFLLDSDGSFYFLEMNTRIQVEHPVTEMITGVDLVQWQMRIARGERLTVPPDQLLRPHGHAIECRIYAEDADGGFLPSPGRITSLRVPSGPGIRDDGWAETGTDVPIFYDPLISKLIAWGEDRPAAITRMRRALLEYEVCGIQTSLPFFQWMLGQPGFAAAQFHTEFLDGLLQHRGGEGFSEVDPSAEEVAAVAACIAEAFEEQRPAAAGPSVQAWRSRPTVAGSDRGHRPTEAPGVGDTWKKRARLEGLRP
jgi:acetyl-CoA carboxylase biotin carboxylase subunit